MFNLLTKLTKATIAVALTPIAVVIDIVTIPMNDMEPHPFIKTADLLKSAGDNIKDALK